MAACLALSTPKGPGIGRAPRKPKNQARLTAASEKPTKRKRIGGQRRGGEGQRAKLRQAEEQRSGQECPQAMAGNVHKTVEREKQGADKRGIAQALVGPLAQRKSPPNE